MENSFLTKRACLEFWTFALIVFCCATGSSTLAFLPVILDSNGLSSDKIGYVLSIGGIPMILAALFSGILLTQYKANYIAIYGVILILIGHASFHLTSTNFQFSVASKFIESSGWGIFIPSSMYIAKNKLTTKNAIYLFGIFSSMNMLPYLFGPYIAELYLDKFGTKGYFIVTSTPILSALILSMLVTLSSYTSRMSLSKASHLKYSTILVNPSINIIPPCICIFVIGLQFGFIPSFMTMYLGDIEIFAATFFTPFAVGLIVGRFGLLKFIQNYGDKIIVSISLLAVSFSYSLLVLYNMGISINQLNLV